VVGWVRLTRASGVVYGAGFWGRCNRAGAFGLVYQLRSESGIVLDALLTSVVRHKSHQASFEAELQAQIINDAADIPLHLIVAASCSDSLIPFFAQGFAHSRALEFNII